MSPVIGLIPLLLFLVVVVLVVLAVLMLKRRRSGEQQPACGKCGYFVKGLTTFTCPECGSDLREVGIMTAGSRRPLSALAKGIIWTIALPLPALLVSSLIVALGPQDHRHSDHRVLSPSSRAYVQIALAAEARGPSAGSLRMEKLSFRLTPNPNSTVPTGFGELTVDPSSFGYRYVRPDGRTIAAPSGLDAKVILDWMSPAGINVADSVIQTEAGELVAQAQAMCTGGGPVVATPSFTSLRQSSSGRSSPAFWLTAVLVAFWPGVWLAGLWYIIRRRPQPSAALQA